MYVYVCIYTHRYTYIYIYICVCVCVCVYTVYAYIYNINRSIRFFRRGTSSRCRRRSSRCESRASRVYIYIREIERFGSFAEARTSSRRQRVSVYVYIHKRSIEIRIFRRSTHQLALPMSVTTLRVQSEWCIYTFGLYTILPLPIWYCAWHADGGSGGGSYIVQYTCNKEKLRNSDISRKYAPARVANVGHDVASPDQWDLYIHNRNEEIRIFRGSTQQCAVLAVCCVRCGPRRLLCWGGDLCGGKHIIITSSRRQCRLRRCESRASGVYIRKRSREISFFRRSTHDLASLKGEWGIYIYA